MRILGIIPARGGSKGVPRKNIKLLAGKPLLAYTAEAALKVPSLSSVILSTDDPEIAETGKQLGLSVPFLRPSELAGDTTPTLPVVQHALNFLKTIGEEYDAVCLLQATNPLRKPGDIEGCIQKFIEFDYDSLFSMLEIPTEHNPYWAFVENDKGLLNLAMGGTEPISRRQLLPMAYYREGSVYIAKSEVILEKNSLYGEKIGGYLIESPVSINIDTISDWERAEEHFKNLK